MTRNTRAREWAGLAAVTVLAACGAPAPAGPGSPLVPSVLVEPQEVAVGDSVRITVRVVNPSATPLTLQFRSGCILADEVRVGDQVVAPSVSCPLAITDFTFPSGLTERTVAYQVGNSTLPIGAGTYQVYGGVGRPLVGESDPVTLVVTAAAPF